MNFSERSAFRMMTGEHSCIVLRRLGDEEQSSEEKWLQAYWTGEASSFTGVGGGGGEFLKVCTKEKSLLGKVHKNHGRSHRYKDATSLSARNDGWHLTFSGWYGSMLA